MEPVRLWRDESKFIEWYADHATHVGLTRADYDALVKERDQARRQRDGMAEQYEAAMEIIHRNAGARRDGLCGILAWIDEAKEATARANTNAVAANLMRDRAERAEAALKLAKDAMENVISGIKAGATPAILLGVASMCRHVAARIDAHLDAPTHDDRRGEDGQAASIPTDTTKPAPAATSAAGCTEQKEP